VEEEHPAPGGERGCGQRRAAAGKSLPEQRDRGQAADREQRREEAHGLETAACVRDDPGEQEVERGPATLAEHDVEQVAEGLAADEERQGLVLVRRPAGELDEEKRGSAHGEGGDAGREQPPVEVVESGSCELTRTPFDCGLGHGRVRLRGVSGRGWRWYL
jgi:hypothetical protein